MTPGKRKTKIKKDDDHFSREESKSNASNFAQHSGDDTIMFVKNAIRELQDLPLVVIISLVIVLLPLSYFVNAFDVFGVAKYTVLVWLGIANVSVLIWRGATKGQLKFPSGWLSVVLFTFVTWLALSTFFSSSPLQSFFGLRLRYLGFLTYAFAISFVYTSINISWNKKNIKIIFYSLCAVAMVVSLIGIAQYAGGTYPFDLKKDFALRSYSTFGNPAFFGHFLAVCIPISFYLLVFSKDIKDRVFGLTASVFIGIGLFTASSASAFAGALISVSVMFIWIWFEQKKISKRILIILIVLVSMLFAYSLLYWLPNESSAINQRLWIWTAGLKVANSHPFFGAGLENLTLAIKQLSLRPSGLLSGGQYEDAHNSMITLAASAGWPALIFGTMFMSLVLVKGIQEYRQNRSKSPLIPVLIAGLAGYLIPSQFNPENISTLPLVWIFLGIIIALSGQTKIASFATASSIRFAAGLIVVVVLGGGLFLTRPFFAEINILKGSRASSIDEAMHSFALAQQSVPWQTAYYTMEIDRLLPSLRRLDDPLGIELLNTANKVLSINPNAAPARSARGKIYAQVGMSNNDPKLNRQALAFFAEALRLDIYDPEAIHYTALLNNELGHKKAALFWIKKYKAAYNLNNQLADLEMELRKTN